MTCLRRPWAVPITNDGSKPAIWRLTATCLYWFGRIWLSLDKNGFALALCAIVLIAVGLRAYALDYQSVWTDEIFSLMTTDPTLKFHEFWDRVLTDTHPPIYYLLLRLWSTAVGQSEIAARMPSAFFGVLTVCGAAIVPGSSLSRTSRLAFLLLLAISPGAVWYAREARSYALLLLLSTFITLTCIRFLQCMPHEDRKARGAIATLTAVAALASFTHYFGFLLAAAAFLTCFILTNRWRRAIVVLGGTGVVASFCPLGGIPFPIHKRRSSRMDREVSGRCFNQLVRVPVIRRDGFIRAVHRHGRGAGRDGRLAPPCGMEFHDLRLQSSVLADAHRSGRDLAPHADRDEPQHDRHPSGSVLDRRATHLVLGEALGQSRGDDLPCRSGGADGPAASRVLHDRDKRTMAGCRGSCPSDTRLQVRRHPCLRRCV